MNKNEKTLKIGLVGCGGIAGMHGIVVDRNPRFEFAACADLFLDKAQAYADKFSIPGAFGSMKEMLKAVPEIDLVLLATFPANHLREISEAIELGARAILCEKALAMNGEEGEEIRKLVSGSGIFLMEALHTRHHPQMIKAKELIEAGSIGSVSSIQAHFSDFQKGEPDPDNWRTRVELGGGTLAAKGCYLINAANYFAGAKPVETICHTTLYPGRDFDIAQTATIVYGNAVTAQIEASHRSIWKHSLTIHGTEGFIEIPWLVVTVDRPRRIHLCQGGGFAEDQDGRSCKTFTFPAANSYELQLENIREVLIRGAEPNLTLEESVMDLHVTSSLLASAKSRKWEPVKSLFSTD